MSAPVVDRTATGRALIAPLTGVRAVAAFWVVTRHFRTELIDAFPWIHPLAPLMNVGYLGVDLFFVLSGFILTHTHFANMGDRLPPRDRLRSAAGFLWLRIGRVWPLTAFTLLLFGLAFLAQFAVTGNRAWLAQLDVSRLLQHLALVQAWTAHPLDWNGLDWSISAEWLAYLSFALCAGVLGLVVRRLTGTRVLTPLLAAGIVALCAPVMIVGFGMQDEAILLFSPDGYVLDPGVVALRVLCEFWAGALLAVLLRNRISAPSGSRVPVASIVAVATIVGIYLATALDPVRWMRPGQAEVHRGVSVVASTETIVVLPLIVAFLAALVLFPADPLTRLLGTRAAVLGGKVSFALYLSHPLVIGASVFLLARTPVGPATAAVTLATLVAAWALAWLLWRFVEEPARRWSRRRLPANVRV